MWGFFTLVFSAALIALGNRSFLITLLGWLGLIKGTYILIFPNSTISIYKKFNKDGILVFGGILAIILGLLFLI